MSGRHILVVDDDQDVRDVLVELLSVNGFTTSAADSGTAMRDLLTGEHISIDAIILDCAMPGEPSAQLALHAKQLCLPVVMVSGSPEAMKFAEENHLQLLKKPFGMDELLREVETAISSDEFGQRSA